MTGEVAQSVEQRTENPCVDGSIPSLATSFFPYIFFDKKMNVIFQRLSKDQTRISLERFSINAIFRAIFDILCGGTTFAFVAFASTIGIRNEKMGFITTITTAACLLQIAAIPLGKRFANKKRFILSLSVLEPIFFMLAIIVALLLPSTTKLYAIAIAIFLSAIAQNLSRPHADEWFSSVIPEGIRGRYLGKRLQIYSATLILSTLLAGWSIDHIIGRSNTIGLAFLLIIGGISGLFSIITLADAFLPQISSKIAPSLTAFKTVLSTPSFIKFLIFILLFNTPFYFACPYYQVFNLQILKMPALLIAVMQAGYYLSKIIFMPLIGKLLDKGNHPQIIVFTGILYTIFFLAFPFCSAERHWPLLAAWILAGIADATFGIISQIILYKSIPFVPSRQAFFAVYNLATLIGYGLASFIAVFILNALNSYEKIKSGEVLFLSNFHLFYTGCAILMAIISFSFLLINKSRYSLISTSANNAQP